ncbi:GNAT family N-acetyltransferase [Bacillus sp. FJAT-49732]|uniref:GNAT family N-acetyltransferase n=1 Tax=Lederbergia citrisecunda TaxID=2833583 RepID=A0A942TKZ6_9BACI|nr:GNAT family N-acetyltransferase [Lederbergia citrisecunda]MBS4199123.1 GNAT family N-acetyltransferase [Lederbergia citrisecunda]
MNVTLSIVPYEDKVVLSNLIQLYRYDSSEFDGHILGQHGLYLYKYLDHQWTEDYRRPLIVKVDGEIAGFALVALDVPRDFTKLSNAEKTNIISDFFIMRKFRRKGIGKQVAFSIFKQFKGVWEVRQTYENKPAYAFWKKVISEFTKDSSYQEEMLESELWHGPAMVFQSS